MPVSYVLGTLSFQAEKDGREFLDEFNVVYKDGNRETIDCKASANNLDKEKNWAKRGRFLCDTNRPAASNFKSSRVFLCDN